jgi:hypothetical protein
MNTYYNGRSSFPRRVFGIRLKVDAEVEVNPTYPYLSAESDPLTTARLSGLGDWIEVEAISLNLNLISHTVASVSAAWRRHS